MNIGPNINHNVLPIKEPDARVHILKLKVLEFWNNEVNSQKIPQAEETEGS